MVRLILFILKQLWSVIRFSARPALRVSWFAGGVSVRLSVLAILSMFMGIDREADIIASVWTKRAVGIGFPDIWELQLHSFFYVLAFCTILAGWFVLGFTLSFIIDLLV